MPIVRSRSPLPRRVEREESPERATTSSVVTESTEGSSSTVTTAAAAPSTAAAAVAAANAALRNAATAIQMEPPATVRQAASNAAAAVAAANEALRSAAAATLQAEPPALVRQAASSQPTRKTRTAAAAAAAAAAASMAAADVSGTPAATAAPSDINPLARPSANTCFTVPPQTSATTKATSSLKTLGGSQNPPCRASGNVADVNPKTLGGDQDPPCRASGTAARSTRSSRRMELEAKRELQKKQLEVARTAAALAQTELELAQCCSEDEIDDEFEAEKSTHVEQWIEQAATFEVPKPEEESTKSNEMKELAEAIITAARMVQPPPSPPSAPWKLAELPYFNGAFEEWLPFKRAYNDSANQYSEVQNMARLRKAIQGTAKEAVRSLLFVASDPNEVVSALERRFGRPEQLVLAEIEKIKELPKLNDQPRDLCVFASRISNAVATISALNKPQYLYSPEVSKCTIEKLTPILKYRYYDYSARNNDDPELVKIKKFLEYEADLCGNFAPPETLKKRNTYSRHPVHAAREEEEEDGHTVATSTEARKKFCMHCKGEHWVTECKEFKEASPKERWEIAKKRSLCFRCLRRRHQKDTCKGPSCKKCKRSHHTMLHMDPLRREAPDHQEEQPAPVEEKIVKSVYAAADGTKVYLKMIPVDIYGPHGSVRVLALMDEGSTVSLLDASVAAKIGATGKEESLTLETVGGKLIKEQDSQRMDIRIKGVHRRDKKILKGVRTVEGLKLAPQVVNLEDIERCKHLKKMKNELLYEKGRPSLLIGQDNWDLIVSRKILKGKSNEPAASLTTLGWVLHGYSTGPAAPVSFINHCRATCDEECIDELIKHHFELDSIGIQQRRPSNDADGRALALLRDTTKRRTDGRFESGLLWKTEDETLPNNYVQAYNRLQGIEKKIDKNPTMKEEYGKQLQHLLNSGYAEEAPAVSTPGRTFYLPHFAVVHPTKKKMRIVFDAAARHEGKSLNDALLPGPDLLQSLFGVLLRFRQEPVAVVADIKEMFLQIRIRDEDRDSLRYLWRGDDRKGKPKEYRMTSVIFGAASSPATAIFVKNANAKNYEEAYPEATKAIVRNHYMDDYLQSFNSIEDAVTTAEKVNEVHKAAGFQLRQWASNKKEVLQRLTKNEESPQEINLASQEEKTLGLRWLADEDKLAFNIGLRNTPSEVADGGQAPTKRQVTSAVMSTFDPMGLVAPVLIKGKKLIQDIWRTGTKWDEQINEDQHQVWTEYKEDVKKLQELKIPRCLSPTVKTGQLHTFVDASETTYACATYWRTTAANGEVQVTLIAGKARVAPIKCTSIPRLELQAALMGARLATTIAEETDLVITHRAYWSDSSTVLQWLKSDPRRFKSFVAHRLAELEDLTKPCEWRWVPSKENPADDATRELPKHFNADARWFVGPKFLYQPESEWPAKRFEKQNEDNTGEERKHATVTATTTCITDSPLPDAERFSSWTRLLRTTARVFMFIDLCKKKLQRDSTNTAIVKDDVWKPYKKKETKKQVFEKRPEEAKRWLPIEPKHMKKAEIALLKKSQEETFIEEIRNLKKNLPLERSSKLKKIDVGLDEEGILRLNSRTSKITGMGRRENLIVLEGRHKIAHLLIEEYHRRFYHGNHATVINELRQKYWILSLRNSVKKVLHKCQWCRVRRMKPQMPPLGDLPAERLHHHAHPFTCTAVDYFGPMHVTIGRRKEKRWGALFTCLTTRSIHLEMTPSLSTSSMIMALRRMAARRGSPRVMYSDNGTNFVGADRELKMEAQKMKREELIEAAEREGIIWKFIAPGAPHMGGAWERMVRTVKVALTAVLNERSPPEEVLHTLLTEVEHTVNSRPLTHISADPTDEEALTPNHFLIGRSCGAAVLGEFNDRELIGKADWKTAQRLADHFWQRWIKEYLPTLMVRKLGKDDSTDPQKGDIVIIGDASLPRNTWPRGEVVKVYQGPDGRTRIVDVRTAGGVLRRPTSRLIIVVPASQREDGVLGGARTGGEIVNDAT